MQPVRFLAADVVVVAVKPGDVAPSTPDLGRTLMATNSIIGFWKGIVALLVAGYQAGFLWVAAVGIYLLLRRDIDGVQTGEVFVDQAEEYGMPPLVDDEATLHRSLSEEILKPRPATRLAVVGTGGKEAVRAMFIENERERILEHQRKNAKIERVEPDLP